MRKMMRMTNKSTQTTELAPFRPTMKRVSKLEMMIFKSKEKDFSPSNNLAPSSYHLKATVVPKPTTSNNANAFIPKMDLVAEAKAVPHSLRTLKVQIYRWVS